MKLCDYGCGKPAIYKFKNGKQCCSESPNKCLAMRKKNSIGGKGKNKHKFYKIIPNEGVLCYYGCGNIAMYMTGQNDLKPCCSKHYNQCSIIREKITKSNIGKTQPRGKDSKLFGRKRPDQSIFMKKNNPMFDINTREKHNKSIVSDNYRSNMSYIVKKRWKNKEYRKKYREAMVEKGLWFSDEDIDRFEVYKSRVKSYTRESIYKFYYDINPNNYLIGRGEDFYNIDHIYSIVDGFKNNIYPKIIGSYVNLQMLPWLDNIRKYSNSWITKDELIKRYSKHEDSI